MFSDKLSAEQIASVYKISGSDFIASMECLLSGPTLKSLLTLMNSFYSEQSFVKLDVDNQEIWEDAVAFYKSSRLDFSRQVKVQISDQPAIDAGGVRAQFYSTVYDAFATNSKVTLFDGAARRLRPHCSAEARASGLFRECWE